MLRKEILTDEQFGLLPLVKSFSGDFGLVGGTAIALHLGHRRSIDFDLFSLKEFDNPEIRRKISKFSQIDQVIRDETNQFSLQIKSVRFTFFYYPYPVIFSNGLEDIIKLPDLLTLAAMKAFALGRRAKWKDYVDLYFIARQHHGIKDICEKAKEIFGNEFNEKLFRTQLAYFNDINYSEAIIFMPGFEVGDEKIKQGLIEFSLI
ncbi:MAG: nucleotidyl transferase AbiEii/AbiGii toxin family protein [Patescibacteria group bacterium]